MFIALIRFGIDDQSPVPYIVNNEDYVGHAGSLDFRTLFHSTLQKIKTRKKKTWKLSDVIQVMKDHNWQMMRINNFVDITI